MLSSERQLKTLSSMLRVHSSFYRLAIAGMYNRIDLTTSDSHAFFAGLILPTVQSGRVSFTAKDQVARNPPSDRVVPTREMYVPSIESHRRKLYALSQVHELHLHSFPDHTLSRGLVSLVQMLNHSSTPSPLFPAMTSIFIGPEAIWTLIDCLTAPSPGYGHPFTAVLTRGMRPRNVIALLPDFSKKRIDWMNSSALPRAPSSGGRAERRQAIIEGWKKLLKVGPEIALGRVVRTWKPEMFTLSGVVDCRGVAVAGTRNRVMFGQCHCVRNARRAGTRDRAFGEGSERAEEMRDGQGSTCHDHVTSQERVKGVLRMLENALHASERDGDGNESGEEIVLELLRVGVSDDRRQTEEIVGSIRNAVRQREMEGKVKLEVVMVMGGVKMVLA